MITIAKAVPGTMLPIWSTPILTTAPIAINVEIRATCLEVNLRLADLSGGMIGNPSLVGYLEKKRVTLKATIEVARELFVPHPGVPHGEKAIEIILKQFREALRQSAR